MNLGYKGKSGKEATILLRKFLLIHSYQYTFDFNLSEMSICELEEIGLKLESCADICGDLFVRIYESSVVTNWIGSESKKWKLVWETKSSEHNWKNYHKILPTDLKKIYDKELIKYLNHKREWQDAIGNRPST